MAIARLDAALRRYIVLGIRTNVPFLRAILAHPRFATAAIDTGFLDSEREALVASLTSELPLAALAAAAAHQAGVRALGGTAKRSAAAPDPFETLTGWGLA